MYPLSLFIYVPKWDNVNAYLPYRYFISDFVWNGQLPLWNPFQRMGFPVYSDLQGGAWNPIVWVIMLFGKYTMNSLIIELLSCYVFAGLGMYKLSNYLYGCKKTSFIIGLSYALSGFMVGSSQLMVFLIAVTWFPWIIYSLLNFFKNYSLKYQLISALFMALFITGASPAYTILLAYIVVGIFVYQFIINRKAVESIKQIVKGGLVIFVALISLSLPYINAFFEFAPYFNRAEGLEYNGFLLANPFAPISYISFLLPDAVIAQSDWFNITDLSLRNGYFGIIGLIGMLSALLSKFNKTKIILVVGIVISLMLAAGDEFFLFKYVFHLPGFNVFRHPSIFRAFTIFCALLLAGIELKNAFEMGFEKRHKLIATGLFGVIVVIGVWALTKTSFSEVMVLLKNISNSVEFSESALSTHLLLNSIVVLGLMIMAVLMRKIFKWPIFVCIAVIVVLDLGIHTRISSPTTITYPISQNKITDFFSELPNKINQKENYTPLKNLDEKQPLKKTDGIWKNISTYNKTLSYEGLNPMRFKRFDAAKEDGRLSEVLEHNIVYVAEKPSQKLENIKVDYNTFWAQIVASKSEQTVVLNQNYHHLWSATLGKMDLEITPYNDFTMQVKIPKNTKGQLQFEYKSPKTIYAFIISLLAYGFVLIYLFWQRKTSLK